jgi:cbb3-type cytochrome oxidase maturation protein
MNVLYFLVPLALILAASGVWAFVWSVRNGQFEDVETPGMRMLFEEEEPTLPEDPHGEAQQKSISKN